MAAEGRLAEESEMLQIAIADSPPVEPPPGAGRGLRYRA